MKKQSKILKEESLTQHDAASHISNDAENFLSKDMVKYIEHAVDPKHAPVALRPAPATQYIGLCQKLPLLFRGEFSTGTNGFGYVSVSPANCAGCSDRLIALSTNATYTGSSASPISIGGAAGISIHYPSKSPFTGASLVANDGEQFQSMVNACGVYVKPVGSATTQNGRMFLLEVPGHPGNGVGNLTLDEIMSHPRTRVISAIQLGSPGFQNVLNWHPQVLSTATVVGNDNSFRAPQAAATTIAQSELIIVATGDALTKYEFEIYASYACRGSFTQPTSPMYSDPLGWAAYSNAVSDKRISGWVGTSSMASSIYKGFASRSIRKLQPQSVQDLEKARAKLDDAKAAKTGAAPSNWFSSMKKLAPVAKEMGGFLLNLL